MDQPQRRTLGRVLATLATAKSTIDLTGWNLTDGEGVSYTFPSGR